jgi:hypothetical protein
MIMAGKWVAFDGAFNDNGASASSSPIWMIGMVDSIVGDSKTAFLRKVSLGNEHRSMWHSLHDEIRAYQSI